MTVSDYITARQIDEVVHFTSSHGCLGTLYTQMLQSRQRLEGDPMVEYLFKPNAALRKDPKFLDYVSLSVSHINTQFYNTSSSSWHRDEPIFWCVLSFTPTILTDQGVIFTTTNNIYTGVQRAEGPRGLAALYADRIIQWTSKIVHRKIGTPANHTTCFQAEVLYPTAVSTKSLQRIYVQTQEHQNEIVGFLKATFHHNVEVLVEPKKFLDRVP